MFNSSLLKKGLIPLNNVICYSSIKKQVDYSHFPLLDEKDLEEQHIRGSGPGGSKISTTSSCVVLKHIPTGIVVKCQETRYLEQNRKRARLILLTKLDNHLYGEDSIEAQTKRLQAKRKADIDQKKEKKRQLKQQEVRITIGLQQCCQLG